MTSRRKFLLDICAVAASALAIVGFGSTIGIRGGVMPLRNNYYGFTDRLWIKCRYENGELRGRALTGMLEQRILQVLPAHARLRPRTLGTGDLSFVARQERRETLWPRVKNFHRLSGHKS